MITWWIHAINAKKGSHHYYSFHISKSKPQKTRYQWELCLIPVSLLNGHCFNIWQWTFSSFLSFIVLIYYFLWLYISVDCNIIIKGHSPLCFIIWQLSWRSLTFVKHELIRSFHQTLCKVVKENLLPMWTRLPHLLLNSESIISSQIYV